MSEELKRELAEAMWEEEPKSDLIKRQKPYPVKMVFITTPQQKSDDPSTSDTGELAGEAGTDVVGGESGGASGEPETGGEAV